MIFIDTNYFLRYLLEDNRDQSEKAKELLLRGARGEIKLISSIVVFMEIYWVLKSFYGRKTEAIEGILKKILAMSFIKWRSREILWRALELWDRVGYDLEDAYNLVYAGELKVKKIASFDRRLRKVFKEEIMR